MTGQSHATNRLPRFDYHVGFVSAPGGFDCSPQEFLRVAPQRTGVIQRVLSIQGYNQTLPIEGRARSFHLVEEAVMALGFSRCQVVGARFWIADTVIELVHAVSGDLQWPGQQGAREDLASCRRDPCQRFSLFLQNVLVVLQVHHFEIASDPPLALECGDLNPATMATPFPACRSW